VVEMSLR
jgi:hypothetical protein